MKVTLQVNGREMTFSEVESITIDEEVTEKAKQQNKQEARQYEVAPKPTEGKWFEIKPQAIDQGLFKEKRTDGRQEETRLLILEAFAEVKANPEKYGRNFKTMMPKKIWNYKTVAELKEMASQLGDHNADWVEQALEWAQRIANGETWEAICNEPDTADWFRLVKWKNGYWWIVGGWLGSSNTPASDVCSYRSDNGLNGTVPLVVLYEKVALSTDTYL